MLAAVLPHSLTSTRFSTTPLTFNGSTLGMRRSRSGAGQARRPGCEHLSPRRCSRSIVIGRGLEPARER